MRPSDPRVLVIGAGQNGLAAAILLARGGRKVVVVEASPRAGGLAAMEEWAPGFRVPGLRSLRPPAG